VSPVTAVVAVPAITTTATSNVTVTPVTIVAIAQVLAPTVSVPLNATISAQVIAALVAMPAPTVSALTIFRDVDWTFGRAVQ
jgi:hypothetical protein